MIAADSEGIVTGMRRRPFRWRVPVCVVVAIFASCSRKAEKPAGRPEALAACLDGCLKQAPQAPPSQEHRRACDQLCGCIIDEMFQADGTRRKDPKLLPDVSVACVQKVLPAPSGPSGAVADDDSEDDDSEDEAPPPRNEREPAVHPDLTKLAGKAHPDPRLALGPTLVTGKGCGNASRLPRLTFEVRTARVRVPGQTVGWRFPWNWGRPLAERRDVMALSIGANYSGIIPVFEIFVAPRCDSYDTLPVFERLAARSLIDLAPQADTVDQVRRGGWKIEQGGPNKASSIVHTAVISTPKGPRRVWLYTTKLAESKSFSVHAAGACPGLEPGSNFVNMCEGDYFTMLKALTAQDPLPSIPILSP
ncbi:MAG TPA: hypothetical protein VKQ32_26745 [Polyangia bacterium]|nr:hypothetical protein [Polyangia bacterium]